MSLTDKFDRNRRRNQVGKIDVEKTTEDAEVENFSRPGHMRNISFVQTNGKKEFFSYADLTNGTYAPEANTLVLIFRSVATVELKGRNLDQLYEQVRHQVTKQIICLDKRYDSTTRENEIAVHEMNIIKNL